MQRILFLNQIHNNGINSDCLTLQFVPDKPAGYAKSYVTRNFETLSCQDFLYSWNGYAHGFSRGHSVLIKENRIIFIAIFKQKLKTQTSKYNL